MSEFIPPRKNETEELLSSPPAPTLLVRKNVYRLSWVLSLILHLIACGALLLIGIAAIRRPTVVTRPDSHPAKMASIAHDPETEEARSQVRDLLRTRQQLERLSAQKQSDYEHWRVTQQREVLQNLKKAALQVGQPQPQSRPAQSASSPLPKVKPRVPSTSKSVLLRDAIAKRSDHPGEKAAARPVENAKNRVQSAAKPHPLPTQADRNSPRQHLSLSKTAGELPASRPSPHIAATHRHEGTEEGGPHGEGGGLPDLRKRDLAQLYDMATDAEKANLEAFRQIQARAAAMAQNIPLEQALEATDATPPVRPILGKDEQKTGANAADMSTLSREQRDEARQQIAAMAALSSQLLRRVRPIPGGAEKKRALGRAKEAEGSGIKIAALAADSVPSPGRIALATEENGRPAKDMTGVDLPAGLPGETKPSGRDSRKWSKTPLGQAPRTSAPPPSPPMDIQAVPGRIVGAGTMGAGWMFVDSWYTIGPFPNPQRQNINKPFPPESGVDLDAQYVGKDNRIVRWQWMQSASPMLIPQPPEEYAIYYGYTELWFDEPEDLWIAVGSDDKSTLWVEDQLVWVSSDVLKGWRIDEGMRKVRFRKGLNRVLFRLENGWRGMGFSLCLCLQTSPAPRRTP